MASGSRARIRHYGVATPQRVGGHRHVEPFVQIDIILGTRLENQEY